MNFPMVAEAFDGCDLFPLHIGGQRETGKLGCVVDQDGARPASAQVATPLRPRQSEIFSQDFEKGFMNFCENGNLFAVNMKLENVFHVISFQFQMSKSLPTGGQANVKSMTNGEMSKLLSFEL
jgi:hypothetical protein